MRVHITVSLVDALLLSCHCCVQRARDPHSSFFIMCIEHTDVKNCSRVVSFRSDVMLCHVALHLVREQLQHVVVSRTGRNSWACVVCGWPVIIYSCFVFGLTFILCAGFMMFDFISLFIMFELTSCQNFGSDTIHFFLFDANFVRTTSDDGSSD